MAANKEKRVKGTWPQISSADDLRQDPFCEESTDFRGTGEKFEIMPEGQNLDLSRMDQPRTNLESLPKAHKDKTRVPAPNAGGKKQRKDRAA